MTATSLSLLHAYTWVEASARLRLPKPAAVDDDELSEADAGTEIGAGVAADSGLDPPAAAVDANGAVVDDARLTANLAANAVAAITWCVDADV
jgi:hypothetical protein